MTDTIKAKNEEPPSADGNSDDDDPGGASILFLRGSRKNAKPLSFLKTLRGKVNRFLHLRSSGSIEEEVADLIEEHDPDGMHVSSEERSILHNVLGLSDSKVSDVMIPRTDIVAVSNKISLNDLKTIIIDKEHTRTPVYKESLDNVIGFIHIKDLIPLLGTKKAFDINKVIRKILYIAPSMKVVDLLVKMRAKRVHMALVLDEYGGTDGLVTMEDLVEEIVGEIEDEHDGIEEDELIVIDENTIEIKARLSVEELEEKLGVELKSEKDDEDFETVGGLIFFMLGRVPEQGEKISHPAGFDFEILESDPRRIKKLLIKKVF